MLRKTLFWSLAAILVALATSSQAAAWYSYHYRSGGYGGYRGGSYGYHYGSYRGYGGGGYHYGYVRRY